jgi:hypothetical protein
MANKNNSLLNQIGNGFLKPKGQMGDWQHAARTFVDDDFRLAPKVKFLYHVYFNINKSAVKNLQLNDRNQKEISLLVKSVDLPKFSVKALTFNQYNRKKIVQTTHEFQPINIGFHDDRSNIINNLWQSYYAYYYADSLTGKRPIAYKRNAMQSNDYLFGYYGLDNNSSLPFFNDITIYQLNKREYASYTLLNPVISAFNSDNHLSSDQGTASGCTMTLMYEAVSYDSGVISSGNVKGFAQAHYDKSPSPLSAAGGGTNTLFGTGGVVAGATDIFNSLALGDKPGGIFNSLENFVNTTTAAINTYQNTRNLTKAGLKEEGKNLLVGGVLAASGVATTTLKNTFFPSTNTDAKTQANPIDPGLGVGP